MAVAKARLFSNRSTREAAEVAGVSKARVVQAAIVIDYAPDLADSVLAGATPLNDAYAEARRRKDAAESEEAKFARLQEQAPDIAAMVQAASQGVANAEAALTVAQNTLAAHEELLAKVDAA